MHKPLENQYIIHRACDVSQALFGYILSLETIMPFYNEEVTLAFAWKYGMFYIAEADACFFKKDQ
jgi:hypothetical protein